MEGLDLALIAGHWVAPLVATLPGQRLVRLSITESRSRELRGDAVVAQLFAGTQRLQLLGAPRPEEPLPEFGGPGVNASADFTFSNPQGLIPTRLVVTIGGESTSFDLLDVIPV